MQRLRWCLLAITPLALLSSGRAQEQQPSFSITISAPQAVKAGAPVPLYITVKNISGSRISIDMAMGGAVDFDFVFNAQDSEGKKAPETSFYKEVQGKDPHIVRFARLHIPNLLAPGETLTFNTDLTRLFDFKPGKYTIQLNRPQSSVFVPSQPTPPGPVVTSNIIDLTVTP